MRTAPVRKVFKGVRSLSKRRKGLRAIRGIQKKDPLTLFAEFLAKGVK